MANLQNITPAERKQASVLLARMKRSTSNGVSVSGASRSTHTSDSPAEALLSSATKSLDRIEISSAGQDSDQRRDTVPSDRYNPASVGINQSFSNDPSFRPIAQGDSHQNPFGSPTVPLAWHRWDGEELARLLIYERPLVIAAVLLQIPTELGSALVQSLPNELGAAVLTQLPRLQSTDPEVLDEIHAHLQQRFVQFQAQRRPDNYGMNKLQAILDAVPITPGVSGRKSYRRLIHCWPIHLVSAQFRDNESLRSTRR